MARRNVHRNSSTYGSSSVTSTKIPGQVASFSISRQHITVSGLIFFDKWQGLGWIRVLYYLVLIVNTFVSMGIFYAALTSSVKAAALGCVFAPLFWFASTIGLRVACELTASIILIPHLYIRSQDRLERLLKEKLAHIDALPAGAAEEHDKESAMAIAARTSSLPR